MASVVIPIGTFWSDPKTAMGAQRRRTSVCLPASPTREAARTVRMKAAQTERCVCSQRVLDDEIGPKCAGALWVQDAVEVRARETLIAEVDGVDLTLFASNPVGMACPHRPV